MDSTYHMINRESIKKMKDGVILVNTSRGGLVKTDDLIEGIRARKFFGVGLDVYEEETPNVFEDRSDEILEHSTTARLLSFPNVMITSHQGFFTEEALRAIAETTLPVSYTHLDVYKRQDNPRLAEKTRHADRRHSKQPIRHGKKTTEVVQPEIEKRILKDPVLCYTGR